MTLSTLASIASVLSSVAICASLIYLAVQVQQSDRNQGTLLRHLCANDGDHLEVRRASQHRDRRPRLKRRVRLHDHAADAARNLMRATLFGLQDQFLLEQRALVSPTQVTTNERGVMRMFSAPAFRALWTLSRELVDRR